MISLTILWIYILWYRGLYIFLASLGGYYTIIDFGIGCYLDLSTWKNVIFTQPQPTRYICIPKSMIVLFHENEVHLLTTKCNIIGYWTTKEWVWYRIAKVRFFPIYFYYLRGWYHFQVTCQDLFSSWKANFRIFMQKK